MNNSIGKDALKLSISKIITMSISMFTTMLLSRFRSLEEYGTYSQLMIIINISTTIFSLGLPNSTNYFLARAENSKEKKKFIDNFYSLSTILSLFTCVALVLLTSSFVSYFDNKLIKSFWFILATIPWTKVIMSSIDNILIVSGKTLKLILYRIFNSIGLLLAVILSWIFEFNFYQYMVIFVIIELIFTFVVYLIINSVFGKIRLVFDVFYIKKILYFSLPIGLASVVGVLKREMDKLVIANFFNTEQMAIYTNAARELPITIIASSLTAVLMPQIAKLIKYNQKEEAVILWRNVISFSYVIICTLSFGIFTYAPDVITILYSQKYLAGTSVFRIYALELLFRSTYYGMFLNATGKTKVILYSSIAGLGINGILNIIFYYIFGFNGPALATFISTFISAFIQIIATCKMNNILLKCIFPWKNMFIITIINIIYTLVFTYLKKIMRLEGNLTEVGETLLLSSIWAISYIILFKKLIIEKWNAIKHET